MKAYDGFTLSARKKVVPKLGSVPREVCIVWVDHSVLGVWLTQKEAVRAIALQQRHSLIEVHYRIAKYVIKGDGDR